MTDKKKRLRELILELSYEKRTVTLASGRVSDFYIDGKQTTLNAEGLPLAGAVCLDLIESTGLEIEAVGGPTLGADPIVASIVTAAYGAGRPIHGFIIRKEAKGHGTGQWIEGMKNLKAGMKVAVVEDTMTTGGSGLKAVKHAEEAGLQVEIVICLCDREEGAREAVEAAGYRFASVFTRTELLEG